MIFGPPQIPLEYLIGRLLVGYKGCMRHLFLTILALCIFVITLGGCCAHTNLLNPILSGAQQAQHENQASIALVYDFDVIQRPFCTGVWVAKDTILTANHCIQGYVEQHHIFLVAKALQQIGADAEKAQMLAGVDIKDIPPQFLDSPVAQALIQANSLFPVENPNTVTLQYAVPEDIIDVGVRPSRIRHASALALYPSLDLALLHVTGDIPQHRIAHLADQAPQVGEAVSLVGNTEGTWFNYKISVISAHRHSMKEAGNDNNEPILQLAAGAIDSGDSGGCLFNERGQLVGIVEAVSSRTHYGFCIYTDTIRKMLLGQHFILGKIDVKAEDPDLQGAHLNTEN